MNKKFDSDLYFNYASPQKIENILKFYQTTVNIPELYKPFRLNVLDINASNNYWDIPESFIDSISFDKLSDKEKNFLNKINDFLKNETVIYFLPIIIVNNNNNNIPPGIYSIDFLSNVLYKYKEFNTEIFDEKIMQKNFDVCICYFLDLNYAALLDGELGFINGILQIGRVYENVKCIVKNNNVETYSEFISQQSFSHKLGINCRKQLFIKNLFLKES